MKRIFHLFPIVIALTSACILLAACRAKKEVAEANLSESAATVNSTATGNVPLTSSVAVQSDTNYWQLVYPKTAKTECDLWRKGNIYTLDTNDVKFYKVDTSCAVILVECSWSGDGPMPAFKFAIYAESGGAQYPRPSDMPFVTFLKSLEPEPEIKRIGYSTPHIKLKEKTKKHQEELYKSRNQYYAFGRKYLGYPLEGKVESGRLDIYYKGYHEKKRINIPDNMLLEEYIQMLEADSKVDSIWTVGIYEEFNETTSNTFSDNIMSDQWGLERIYAQDAWDITMGDSTLIVAVLEEDGIDWSHFELGKGHDNYQNIYVNSGEDTWTDFTDSNGRKTYNPQSGNGLDDDEDGFIDNFIGWNFKDNNNDCRTDSCSHGTAVAGIIAAKTNNGRGISGIAGGDSCAGVKILPYAMRRHFGLCLQDATKKNARMANMSFSLGQPNDSLLIIYNSNIQNAFNHGVLMIAASGNLQYPINNVKYPARNPYVMAVGAINKKMKEDPPLVMVLN